ncbi:hypothetical protein BHM03_00046184 [Ensete ventricosum]|nr:hypothetical protein BHM03_00046184 [Ensete ventricosum]
MKARAAAGEEGVVAMDDCYRKLQGVQRQGRKKGQRSGSRLEEAVAAAGGRCWDGKEQLAGDQIRSRSSRGGARRLQRRNEGSRVGQLLRKE